MKTASHSLSGCLLPAVIAAALCPLILAGVGSTLGHVVSSSAPETRCGRRASTALTSVRGWVRGRPQCTTRGNSSATNASANAESASWFSMETTCNASPVCVVALNSEICVMVPLSACVVAM